MTCPKCGNPQSIVTNSRPTKRKPGVRRRRECCACKHRWTTMEMEV